MAAMTLTVGGVTACILYLMMRGSQSDFVCALQKTKGSAVIVKRWPPMWCIPGCGLAVPLRWQKGSACQGVDSTSLCPENFYWSWPLTLFSAVVECNHWEVNGFSMEDKAERFPPERLTMSPHRTLKDWDIWAKFKTGIFSAQGIKVEKKNLNDTLLKSKWEIMCLGMGEHKVGAGGKNHKEMQIIYLASGKNLQLFKSSKRAKNTWGIFFVSWMYHKKSH